MNRYRSALPPLGVFVVFEAAARLESFARAAEELGVTQPAVSKRIRELEQHLNTPLFDRSQRGVRLTVQGQALLSRTAAALDYLNDACANLLGTPQEETLTIAAITPAAHFWLNPLLGSLHPDIPAGPQRIIASDDNRDLLAEDNDLAIFICRGERIGWQLDHLFDEQVLPVASPEYVSRMQLDTQQTIAEQARHAAGLTLLNHDRTDPDRVNWQSWADQFDRQLLTRNRVVEFNSYALAAASALNGEGVVLGSGPLFKRLFDEGQLVALSVDYHATGTAYYLARPEQGALRPPAARLREFLLRQAAYYQQTGTDRYRPIGNNR